MTAPFHPPAIAPIPAPTAAPPPAPMAVRLPGVAQATARGTRRPKVRYFRMTTPLFCRLERRTSTGLQTARTTARIPVCLGFRRNTIRGGCGKKWAFSSRLVRSRRVPRGAGARHRDRLVLLHAFTALPRHPRFLRHGEPVDVREVLIRNLAGDLLGGRVAADELGIGERLGLAAVQVGLEAIQLAENARRALHRFRLVRGGSSPGAGCERHR